MGSSSTPVFNGCAKLSSVTIGEKVTNIPDYAFYGCSGLTNVTIPNSVTSIGSSAFSGCSGLTSVTIPNSVTSIGSSAFRDCSGLTSLTIPNSVASIGNDAFYGCTGLTTIKVETGNSKYDSRNNCNAIIETESNTLIAGCKNTTIPNSVISIGSWAFYGCSSLTSITIPNSVISIGEFAFSGCTSLTSITIPNSVTSIGDYAFNNCIALRELRIEDGETTLSLGYNSHSSSDGGEGLFYDCPLETLYLGRNLSYNTGKNYGYSPFYNNSSLKTVTIGNNVTSIGSWAFSKCTGLTSITIGNSVTSIGDSAFGGCSDLTSVIFNAENCEIMGTSGSPVFKDCNKLSSVTIGENVKSIPDYAFSGCSGLTSVTIPNSVTSIGEGTFRGCSGLKELRIEDGESTLSLGYNSYSSSGGGEGLFYDCPLETLYLGRNVEYTDDSTTYPYTKYPQRYGYSAFYKLTKLKSVTIGNSVTSIGYYAFEGCTGLTSVTIGNSVTSIGNYAFEGCTGLTSVTIGNSVTSIGYYAFEGCTGLTSVTIGNSVTSIGSDAFYGCSGLTSITIPSSVTSIGSDAFFGCTGLCSIKMNATATTQTKLNFDITNNTEYEFYIKVNNKTYRSKDKTIEISELGPGNRPSEYGLIINDIFCKISSGSGFYTKSLNQNIQIETGIISINAKGSYTEGDATILGTMLSFQKEPTEYDNLNEKVFNNLDPNTSYTVYYSVNTLEGGVYSASKTFTTGALTWSDEDFQATSTTSARLVTATNCDATEGTGFEWRRYGAPENLKPNAVACPVIDGMLIGSLRNLNSEVYYEFRPYYTSSSGNKYYGEWTALFTGDANVYFEPEVRTYEDVKVVTNKATLKGYALAGTDDIISQGFEYWESSVQPGTANSLNASVNSKKVEVSGISMTAIVSDLKYGTTYCYRAFATTASGTIYGETVEFTTEKDLSGIENVIVEDDETVEYYNLQGVKIVNPSSGLYIKRQGNKVTKVIL